MRKRTKRNAVYAESSGWMGKGLIVASAAALMLVIGGWWLFVSSSDSGLKKTCLARLSVMVDRFDQLSEAWKNRGVHGLNDSTKKKNVLTDPDHTPANTSRNRRPYPDALSNNGTDPQPENPAPADPDDAKTDRPQPKTVEDVSPADKAQLKKLLETSRQDKTENHPKPVAVETKPVTRTEHRPEIKTNPQPIAAPDPRPAEPPRELTNEDQQGLRDLLKNLD